MTQRRPLIVAIDTPDAARAAALARAVAPHCGLVKLGLEFFLANGPAGVRAVAGDGAGALPVFLDLKLHDIPNTVAGAVASVLPLAPRMLTLHAAGGAAMIEAARRAAEAAGAARPMLLAVTVLTSLDAAALAATGVPDAPAAQVLRLGRLAVAAGADGLVCSAHEAAALRAALGPGVALVVPGIRPAGHAADDQARTMTARQALAAGADWIVVGRPITQAADPAQAAAALAAEAAAQGTS
ncbi:MAG: orotidine-5'-phosphate decarboxylase [Proteobacteria bacterium]|nr:orotidine-5'-phosphate decarboxylase [Pseudomonadota bacterium]